jgi:oligopeptidase A
MTTVDPTNPLFLKDQTPRFEALRTEHVVPAVRQLVADQDQAREALERSATPTWEGLAQPLSDLAEPLSCRRALARWRRRHRRPDPEMR